MHVKRSLQHSRYSIESSDTCVCDRNLVAAPNLAYQCLYDVVKGCIRYFLLSTATKYLYHFQKGTLFLSSIELNCNISSKGSCLVCRVVLYCELLF